MKYKNFEIKEPTVDNKEFTAVISTNDVDLDNEVLLPSGINIKDFKNNPIILFNHNRDLPIGRSLSVRKSGDGLVAKAKLAEGIEAVDNIWKLIKQKVLKGISVGFQTIEQRQPTPADIKMFGKEVRNVISKWKLLEFSVVSVPANQNALITAIKELNIDPKEILPDYVEEKTVEEQIEKEIEKLEVELTEDTKEKIIETVKEVPSINISEVMKYFIEDVKGQIRKNNGKLY